MTQEVARPMTTLTFDAQYPALAGRFGNEYREREACSHSMAKRVHEMIARKMPTEQIMESVDKYLVARNWTPMNERERTTFVEHVERMRRQEPAQ